MNDENVREGVVANLMSDCIEKVDSRMPSKTAPVNTMSSNATPIAQKTTLSSTLTSKPSAVRYVAKRSTPPTLMTSAPSPKLRRIRPTPLQSPTPPTSPQSSKSKVLRLLESKMKGQRNSLYEWVLWREALKGEKDRIRSQSLDRARSRVLMRWSFCQTIYFRWNGFYSNYEQIQIN